VCHSQYLRSRSMLTHGSYHMAFALFDTPATCDDLGIRFVASTKIFLAQDYDSVGHGRVRYTRPVKAASRGQSPKTFNIHGLSSITEMLKIYKFLSGLNKYAMIIFRPRTSQEVKIFQSAIQFGTTVALEATI
jgi:hypothetical protein